MPLPGIEEFGKRLVQQVRDEAIATCEMNLHPEARSAIAVRWRNAPPADREELLKTVIADAVDAAIFQLLHAIDDGRLPLVLHAEDGVPVDLGVAGSGELAGWYLGSGGWRARYSDQRYVDDFADLA